MSDYESLRRRIEEYMIAAEEYVRQGEMHRAYWEFEKAYAVIDKEGTADQLLTLWEHAAAGFTSAEAPLQAAHSHLHIARIHDAAERIAEARDSFLAAANAFAMVRNKDREIWLTIATALEQAIEHTIALDDASMAIELLFKLAAVHHKETSYTTDAINCLERAQLLLAQVPNHPREEDIREMLQFLIESSN
jgi:hypothetical protein